MPSQELTAYLGGYVRRIVSGDDQAAWDSVRDGTNGTADAHESDDLIKFEAWTNGSSMVGARAFYTFTMPDDIVITGATLKCYSLIYGNAGYLIAGTRSDFHTDITTSDWDQVNFDKLYSDNSVSVSGGSWSWPFNQVGINHLNGEGLVGQNRELVIVQQLDYEDTLPTASNTQGLIYDRDNASYYPRLTINYIETSKLSVKSGNLSLKSGNIIIK